VTASGCTINETHCENCGSTDYEDLNTGDQGYSACCNEIVTWNASTLPRPPPRGPRGRREGGQLMRSGYDFRKAQASDARSDRVLGCCGHRWGAHRARRRLPLHRG
jgi:hypothetical protein